MVEKRKATASQNSEKIVAAATELIEAQLDTLSGGGLRKSSGGNTAGQIYLVFNFKLVAA